MKIKKIVQWTTFTFLLAFGYLILRYSHTIWSMVVFTTAYKVARNVGDLYDDIVKDVQKDIKESLVRSSKY